MAVSGRRLWTMTKVYAAVRDTPEVGMLLGLCTGALCMGAYTFYRMYWTPAGEAFPSLEVRRDWEKQLPYGEQVKPGFFYKIAQWKVDDKGYNTGVFDNRARPFEYNLPTKTLAHSGMQYETDVGTRVVLPA